MALGIILISTVAAMVSTTLTALSGGSLLAAAATYVLTGLGSSLLLAGAILLRAAISGPREHPALAPRAATAPVIR